MKLLAVFLAGVGLVAAAAPAQDADQPRAVQDQAALAAVAGPHYHRGVEKQAEAEATSNPEEARRLYATAVTAYEAAVAAEPGHCAALLYWAVCQTQLALLTPGEAEQIRQLTTASRRFAVAADCPGADAVVFEQWAILLRTHLYNHRRDPAQRLAILQETIKVCERGLKITTAPTPRAQLQRHLGSALMWTAEFAGDLAVQRTLLQRAIEHLREASQVVAARQVLYRNGDLGTALLSLGRLTDDQALLQAAARELEAALKFYPNEYDTHYSLAATWSLLGDADQAARYLAVAIDHDPDGTYSRMAANDPDLAAVRGTPAYEAALDRRRRRAAEARATELYEEAWRTQQTAARVRVPATAIDLLQQAVSLYQQAIDLVPDHAPAQTLCATALARLFQLSGDDPGQQRRFLAAARARFLAASQCPEVEPQLFDQWASFLLQGQYPLLDQQQDQARVLQEACEILEEGARRSRFSGLRGRLEAQLATCLVLLAQNYSPSPTNSVRLYTASLKHFQAAAGAESVQRSARHYELWGIALLRVGQATKDSRLVRQATERLLTALELNPDNPVLHYNLACAYAQSRQLQQALRYLERCLESSRSELLRSNALRDPDLDSLRDLEEFRRLLRPRRSPLADQQPHLSEK